MSGRSCDAQGRLQHGSQDGEAEAGCGEAPISVHPTFQPHCLAHPKIHSTSPSDHSDIPPSSRLSPSRIHTITLQLCNVPPPHSCIDSFPSKGSLLCGEAKAVLGYDERKQPDWFRKSEAAGLGQAWMRGIGYMLCGSAPGE